MASGEIPSITLGRVKRVPVAALQEWLERRLAEEGPPPAGGGDGDAAA